MAPMNANAHLAGTGRVLAVLLLCLVSGCGTLGDDGTLTLTTFPQSGLGPFQLLSSTQAPNLNVPYVLLQAGLDTDQPTALAQGDQILLWFTVQTSGATTGSYIGQSVAPQLLAGAMGVSPALVPDQPWEQGELFHPTVLIAPNDTIEDSPSLLLYQGADGSVGAAVFPPAATIAPGATPRKLPTPLATAAQLAGTDTLGSVSAVITGTTLRLYYLIDGVRLHSAEVPLTALQQVLAGGPSLSWQPSAPLLIASDFTLPASLSSTTTPTAQLLQGLSARRIITPTGRERFDLFLVESLPAQGTQTAKSLVAAASSYDGQAFSVIPGSILDSGGDTPTSPAVITYQDQRALMLLGLHSVQTGIAAAQIP